MRPRTRITLAMLLAACLSYFCIAAAFSWLGCEWYGYQTERGTRYAAGVGCMVKTGSGWVPRGELRTAQ